MGQRRRATHLGTIVAVVAIGGSGGLVSAQEPPAPAAEARSYFDGTITLELVAPREVQQGEWLEGLDVVMTNRGSEPFRLYFSGNLMDFHVLDMEGRVIWRFLEVVPTPLVERSIEPGRSIAISELAPWLAHKGRWDLRTRGGAPTPPGVYALKGILSFFVDPPERGVAIPRYETETHTIMVLERPPAGQWDGGAFGNQEAVTRLWGRAASQGLDPFREDVMTQSVR